MRGVQLIKLVSESVFNSPDCLAMNILDKDYIAFTALM